MTREGQMNAALDLVHKYVRGKFSDRYIGQNSLLEQCCYILISDEKRSIQIEIGQIWNTPDKLTGAKVVSFDKELKCWVLENAKWNMTKMNAHKYLKYGEYQLKMLGKKTADAPKKEVEA